MGPSSFILSPCADVERIKLDGPAGGGVAQKTLWRTSTILCRYHVVRIRGCIEGPVFFSSVTGGHWGAVGKVGVPVLRGLGGCSGAGVHFQSVVRYLTHAAESKPTNRTGFCPVLPFFAAILVHFCCTPQLNDEHIDLTFLHVFDMRKKLRMSNRHGKIKSICFFPARKRPHLPAARDKIDQI